MRFRNPSSSDDDIYVNVIPMIDIFLMLLIFFMLSTTFLRKYEMSINLPSASVEETQPMQDTVEVAVDSQGRFFVKDQMLVNSQLYTIREAIRDAASGMEKPTIIINADAQATHQSVVRIMDAARQLGFFKITFTTQKLKEE